MHLNLYAAILCSTMSEFVNFAKLNFANYEFSFFLSFKYFNFNTKIIAGIPLELLKVSIW